MVIPMGILLITKKDMKRWVKLIVILNGFFVFIAFRFINYFVFNISIASNGGAALFWSGINYYILNKHYSGTNNIDTGNGIQRNKKIHSAINKKFSIFAIAVVSCIILLTALLMVIKAKQNNDMSDSRNNITGTWVSKVNGTVQSSWTFNNDKTFGCVLEGETFSGEFNYMDSNNEIVLYLENGYQKVISANKDDSLLRIQIDVDSPVVYYEKNSPGD